MSTATQTIDPERLIRVQQASADLQLADEVASYYADPLGFVKFAYRWGEPGELEQYDGPDKWQAEFLSDLGREVTSRAFDGIAPVPPIRMTGSSGHGIGKSVLGAWIVDWLMSTRPNCKGTVTANTYTQLDTKTWAAIKYWTSLCITGHWFICTGSRMYHKLRKDSWFCSAQTCKEENSEAFAGQHAADSTSFYLADESSAIPDKIFEVIEGGLTDGEPMVFVWGNPTRNSGKFFRINFGSERDRWNNRTIDARDCKMSNKPLIAEWIADYGEDSDFVRVRIKGIPPRAGDLQLIDSERIWAAQRRVPQCLQDDPLIAGVDVARGGDDMTVVRFRKGNDATVLKTERIPGDQSRDSTLVVSKLAQMLTDTRPDHKINMMFVDSAFGGPLVNRLRQLGYRNVVEINFGSASPDAHQANMRAFMWTRMRDWLENGAIDSDRRLETDLSSPGYRHDRHDRLVLESKEDMKKRGLASPDDGDALALTFAQRVAPLRPQDYRPAPTAARVWG